MHAPSPRHRPLLGAFVLAALTALPLTAQQAGQDPPRRHRDVADVVAVSPDGRWVASGSRDGMVEVLARAAGASEWQEPGQPPPRLGRQ